MHSLAKVIRVLHLIQRFYVGGSERQFIERLRGHPEGFEPVVGCLEISGGNLADFRALGLGEPHLFPIRVSLARPNTAVQVLRIARLIRRRGVRIVHGTDFMTNFLGLLAARLAGARMVVSRVDLGHERPGFGPLRRRVEKLVSAGADVVCANAEAVARLCVSEEGCSPEVMDYVALWIEAKYVQDSPKAKPFTILLCTDKLPYIEGKEIAIELL